MSSTSDDPRTYTARWVFPVAGPPLLGGTVTVRGPTIVAVGPQGERRPDEDLGNVAIIPGLVNAHTHLDLTGAAGQIPPTDPDHFTDWLRGVIAYRRARTPAEVEADIRDGLAASLRFGTTLLGDISADGGSWEAVAGVPVRGVVFRELIGLSEARAAAARDACQQWILGVGEREECRPGISPHAPYSARQSLLTLSPPELPVAIHLAESPAELDLIESHRGPFVEFLQALGVWDASGLIRHLDQILSSNRSAKRALFVHCNYLSPETARYFHPGMSIVYCPRTHATFGHAPHPFREFLNRGVRVCLGTDSLASNPDLDLLAEARFVHAQSPDLPGATLLHMATLAGAESLGQAAVAGSLEPGKSADFVVVPLPDQDARDPHALLFAAHPGARRTMFQGAWRN